MERFKKCQKAPNSTVRDLLLKLPGVEEDANGQLTVFGKKVDRIQLEGQDFYDNLDMSADNLPADIAEKIQVTTTKLGREKLTPGPKQPSQNLTINLTLKNNKKQGFLGKGSVSAGTDRRYAGDLSVNRFGGKLRLGTAVNAGNIPRGQCVRQPYF